VGHRLISALIFLNALGFVLCVVLITAAASSDDPTRVAQVSEAVKFCLRLFVAGALPTVAWGILAFEFDRSHSKKRLFESAIVYTVLMVSLVVFVIAGWRLPQAFITGLQISE
jgi:Kef-type K+ transport system membrane component KefB